MKFYLLLLTDIKKKEDDESFLQYIVKHNWEWWRYYPNVFILATPNDIKMQDILLEAKECYGAQFISVLRINIKDFCGQYPNKMPGLTEEQIKEGGPFIWFRKILGSDYIPQWERQTEDISDEDFEESPK